MRMIAVLRGRAYFVRGGKRKSGRAYVRDEAAASTWFLELPQKPHVALKQHPQVGNVVFETRHALDTYTKGEARIDFRIDARIAQHVRIDHAAAQDLEPSRSLAEAATFAVTNAAAHVHFSRRLREREIVSHGNASCVLRRTSACRNSRACPSDRRT